MQLDNKFWVVGIGASAGGLEALTQFVAALPVDSNACFIVAQHLAPHSKSMMVELVARHSPIPVDVVVDGMKLERNRVFIVPPNFDVDVSDERLVLTKAGEETRPKPSVDRFFTSLATAFGSSAIGVILSGTGSDGSDGMRAIKSVGGVTLAQEENSAKFAGMPNSALETGKVDFVLTSPEIAVKISEIIENEAPFQVAKAADETSPVFRRVIEMIRAELGNDFSQYKTGTIRRRLQKRMSAIGISEIEEYADLLGRDSAELRSLAQEFLVSVTSFFRDEEAFAELANIVRASLAAKADGEELRIWSAGCASGEEAYTLAIIATEAVAAAGRKLNVKVFGTDLDTDAISRARVGVYSDREVSVLPQEISAKYFDERGDSFEVKKTLRDVIVFARQDLIQSPPFVKLDLIVCRNVIIYFEPDLQRRIFEIFNYALKPGGVLFLGKSEAITGAAELFEPIDKKAKIFRKITSKFRHLPVSVRTPAPGLDQGFPRRRTVLPPSPVQSAQSQALQRYGIAGAIVNPDGNIETIIGNVSTYLKMSEGDDGFKIQSMLPKGAAVEFQLLLKKAAKHQSLHVSRAFKLHDPNQDSFFQIRVSPLENRESASSLSPALLLVTFDRIEADRQIVSSLSASEGDLALRAAELDQELSATKEHLQTVIEELGVTNEELQSTNEELSSTNEELQSSNEELETTNEEFQSTNEELTTVNEELQVKSSQLRAAFNDLENIQTSISLPLIVVDENLMVQRFNPSTTELFDVSIGDLGRSLSKLSCRCEIESFEQKVRSVVKTGEPHESMVESFKAVYQMRITPRREENSRISGAVIIFFNNTDLIQTEKRLRKSEERTRGVIDGSSSLIFLKDLSGKYLETNEAFTKYFDKNPAQIIGKSDRDLFSDRFANQLRNGDLEAILKRSRIEKQEEFEHGEKHATFLVSRFPLLDQETQSVYGVGTVAVDISVQVATQKALQKSETLYRGVVEDQTVFVARYSPEGTMTFVNAAFLRFFGGSTGDYVGHPLNKIIDATDRLTVREEIGRLSAARPVVQLEHRFSHYGLAPRWIRWINKAVLNDAGDVVEIQAVGFDVSEYRDQIDQMVQREMLFSNIFTYTTDFLTVFRVTAGRELLLESFNRTVDDGGGYTYAQFLGRNVRELVTSDNREAILEKYRICVERKEPQAFEEELQLQGAVRFLATTVIPVLNTQGVVERVVTLSRDVSKYKIAEAELNAAKAAAEVANETKSDFLASMSHELRSPLNVVIGMSELLQGTGLDKTQKEQVGSILRSGKVLLTLIEDILDISKIEAGKTKFEYSNFSMRELLTDVQKSFELQATQKQVSIRTEIVDDDVEFFIGDVNRIRQILTNFVSNAVKFTDRGTVSIRVSSVGHKKAGRRLVRFDVADTGIGIPEEYHSRIFKKFSQVDSGLGRKYGGSGLGLVISQRLTTLMHGQIGFTSEWSKGSTFWFEIPMTIAKDSSVTPPRKAKLSVPTATVPVVHSPAKVLAVDDSPDSRMLLELLLQRLGHQCEIVNSGEAAIDAVQRDDFDLVLMDVQMPGLDGYQSTVKIRNLQHRNKDLPIIALTANAMVGDSEKCFDAGMNDYLTKPINSELLRGAIIKWAARSKQLRAKKGFAT